MLKFPRRTAFRTGLKLFFVAAGLVIIQAVVTGRPSEASEVVASRHGLVRAPEFGLSELIAFPNPARVSSRIRYRLTQDADSVQIKIFDMEGRHIRTLDGPLAAGAQTVEWDLTNSEGHGVASGVYVARTSTSGQGRRTRDTVRIAVQR